MRAHLAGRMMHVWRTATASETARLIADGFLWVMTSPLRYPERAVMTTAIAVLSLIAIGSARVTAAIPPQMLAVAPAKIVKDQSRHPSIDPELARAVFPPPRPLVCDDCPIKPTAVQTISIPKPDEEEAKPEPKAKPKAKGKGRKHKRSDVEPTEPAPIQLASAGDVTIPAEAIEERPATLATPFGTKITTRVSLAKMPRDLIAFLQKVQAKCGQVIVISGYRTGGVPGTCHARNQAIDYQVKDPACALKVAKGFRGGHSVDYYGVQALSRGMPAHYHVSTCPREMGVRFAHRGSSMRVARATRSRTARRARVARNRPATSRRVRVAAAVNPQAHVSGANFR